MAYNRYRVQRSLLLPLMKWPGHIRMALVLFEERGSELAERCNLKPLNSFSLSSEAVLIAWGEGMQTC